MMKLQVWCQQWIPLSSQLGDSLGLLEPWPKEDELAVLRERMQGVQSWGLTELALR